ncbi:tripartite motif-containing protein 7-like isoform X2 [Numida meleagris]|uniref:tripartite motif-containing protein 7-like isoform X2 n=1 Tax=Numida meleagris TaxID=8996 RepID=UPI000B3DB208|nr:tripartite motif-containing protein 7-like isoform X2 [Numida meleagris]
MEAPPAPPAVPPAPCSAARSLQDELTCPVCLEYFTDPVLVAECGHNFCRACVTQCWEDSARRLCCPQCREPVPQRLFRPNRSLGNIVHIVRQLGLPPGPADPPPGPPAPAPPLPAAAPPGPPGPPRCPRHGEPLRLFCVQDRRAVCVVCHLSREHRTHTVLPAEEAAHAAEEVPQEHLSSLRKGREEAKAERERQSEDLLKQTEVERQKIVAECKELRGFLEEKEQLLLSRLEELDRDIVKRRDESVSRLSEEIAQLDKLLGERGGENGPGNTAGQAVTTAGSSFESWMFCKPEPGFAELEKKLKSFSQKSAVLKEVLLEFKENLRFELENDTGDLSLDPDTANPYLVLSEDKRSVRLRSAPQELPAHPKRFDYSFCVLAAEGFVAGRHYWEVEVGDGESWVLGAARESVRRKEKIDFAPEEGIWAVGLNWKGKNWDQYQAFTSPETPLSLCERPRKIGVYLDYEGGWVAFYNADNMAPIFTFTAAFTEKIFPFFWLFYVGSSLSLCN